MKLEIRGIPIFICLFGILAIAFIGGCTPPPPPPAPVYITPDSPGISTQIEAAMKTAYGSSRDRVLAEGTAYAKTPRDFAALAERAYQGSNRDAILTEGVQYSAGNTSDVIYLASKAYYSSARDAMLMLGIYRAKSTDDYVDLAKASYQGSNRDAILLKGVRKATTLEEAMKLADAAYYSSNKDAILSYGRMLPPSDVIPRSASSGSNVNPDKTPSF